MGRARQVYAGPGPGRRSRFLAVPRPWRPGPATGLSGVRRVAINQVAIAQQARAAIGQQGQGASRDRDQETDKRHGHRPGLEHLQEL
jgi:hypothetical protein